MHQADLGRLLHDLNGDLQPVAEEQVILVEASDELTATALDGCVRRHGMSSVAGEAMGPYTCVSLGERLEDRPGLVGRAIVDRDQLEVGERLAQQAAHRQLEMSGAIEHGHHDRDQRGIAPRRLGIRGLVVRPAVRALHARSCRDQPDPCQHGEQMAVDLEISVIVPTRDRASLLDGALDSLVHQTLDPRAVRDRRCRRWQHRPHCRSRRGLPRQPALAGSRAREQCRERSQCRPQHRAAAVTGARCVLPRRRRACPPDHLARVRNHLRTAPGTPGVGGPYVDYGDSQIRTCSACDLGSASLPIVGVGHTCRLLGGNMAIRRVVFDEVGVFDADLSGRGDETEWFERANRTFLYDASLFVWHRRAPFKLAALARIQFEQGKAIPTVAAKLGERWRPSPRRLTRYAAHALLRGCGRGVILSRESSAHARRG